MEDLRVLKQARHYISSMAQGIDPLNGEFAPDGDTISQERIQKCCDYVAGLLDKIIKNDGMVGRRKRFTVTSELADKIEISEEPIGISDFAKRINAVKEDNMRGISATKITSWLAEKGYLSIEKKSESRTRKIINENSAKIGIISKEKVSSYTGEVYEKLLYSADAQRFIIQNLDEIIK